MARAHQAREVEIISVGDELLRGIVADTNSHWMAGRIAARGAALRRVTLLPDEPHVVARELGAALERRPALVLTQGGLGPTEDDRTREAVALATGRALEPHAEAEAIVRRRFADLAAAGVTPEASLDEARARMARLPAGARALDNQVGTAPGVALREGGTTIVLLPGVPPELVWIWEGPLSPILDEALGPGGFAERTVTLELRDESRAAGIVGAVGRRHPEVYVKSRAQANKDGQEVRVTLAAAAANDAEAAERIEEALSDLRRALARDGIAVRYPGP